MAGDGEPNGETKRIYALLRLWGAGGLLLLTGILTMFDVVDDCLLDNRYAGPPDWLTTLVAGLFVALFSGGALELFKRK